jgi:hypothetical protein
LALAIKFVPASAIDNADLSGLLSMSDAVIYIRGYFKTCSGLRQKSQLAFKTKGILANPTTMIARF